MANHQTEVRIKAEQLALVLDVTNVAALRTGIEDGFDQGFELSSGMSYDDLDDQWAYDVGTYIGACLAVRHQPEDQS